LNIIKDRKVKGCYLEFVASIPAFTIAIDSIIWRVIIEFTDLLTVSLYRSYICLFCKYNLCYLKSQKSNRDNMLYGILRWSSLPSHESTLDFGIICWCETNSPCIIMILSLYSAITFPHTILSLALTGFLVLIISLQSDIDESVVVSICSLHVTR